MAPAHRATAACARVSLVLVLCAAVSAAADPSDRLEDGRSELESGEHAEAAREFERGLEEALELDTAEGRGLALILRMELADVYATYPDLGREADAEALLLEARSLAQRGLPPRHPTRVESVRRLGMYYAVQGDTEKAIPALEQFLEEALAIAPVEQVYRSNEASTLIQLYSRSGNARAADELRELYEHPRAGRTTPRTEPAQGASSLAHTEASAAPVKEFPREQLYVEPNATAPDGAPILLHFDPAVTPLRVAVAMPETPAADGSAAETREVAVRAIRDWESAIRRLRPEFRLDVAKEEPSAHIQVVWSDRPPAYSGGTGSVRAEQADGAPRVAGQVILSAKPLPGRGERLRLGEVHAHAVHAFGGALGLGYCQACDSVRSMGWKLRDAPALPTDLDLRTLEALLALPNGTRMGAPPERDGVLADLPFVNTGDDRNIFVDIAKPGAAPFVVQLDTGAAETVMTPVYARALGIAARAVKSDKHRRDTITGKPVLFWVTDQFDGAGGSSGWNYALLGGSYLESYVVEIDVARRRVRLLDPARHEVGRAETARPGEQVAPLRITHGWPLVEVALGTGSAWALLDTGAEGSVNISEEAAARLGIAVDPAAPRRRWRNVLGTSSAAVQRLPTLRIGPVSLHDVEIDIGLRDSGVRIERMLLESELLLGLELLRGFVARIDYPRKRLGLTPNRASAAGDAPP